MVQYKSSNLQYPGDEKMRKNTQMNKKKHGPSDIGLIKCNNHIKRVSYLLYLDEKKHTRRKKDRALHWKYDAIEATFENHKEGACGILSNVWQKTYMECQICKKQFVSRVESVCLVCPVALISMMI